MPFAAVISPATPPCSASGTARLAPAVNPGRVKPKPRLATPKPTTSPYSPVAAIVTISPAAAISDPQTISDLGPRPSLGITPHCAASDAAAPDIIPIALDCP